MIPPPRRGWPSGGFRAWGGSAAACEGARYLPSLPPFINGKPETLPRPGLARVVAAGRSAGGGGQEIDFLCPAHGLWLPPLGAHPWPSASELGPWAVYGGDRAGGAWLPGARVGLRHGGCPREARAPELAWCCSGVLRDAEAAEGAGLGLEGGSPGESGSPRKGAVRRRPGRCRKPSLLGLAFKGPRGASPPPARGLGGAVA